MILDYVPAGIRRKIENIGALVRARPWNCDAPAAVQAQAIGIGLRDAATVLLSFGMSEVIKSWMRPRGIGRRPHVSTRSRRRGGLGIPEIGNELGRVLQHATGTVHHVSAYGALAPVVYGVYRVWDIVSRAGWYLLMMEAVRAGLKGWTTTLAETGFCNVAHLPRELQNGREYGYRPGTGYYIQWFPSTWRHYWTKLHQWSWAYSGPHLPPGLLVELSAIVTVQAPPGVALRTEAVIHIRRTRPHLDTIRRFRWRTPKGEITQRPLRVTARGHWAMLSVATTIDHPWPWPDPAGPWREVVHDVMCVALDLG